MIIVDVEQGTEAWHAARAGKVTASRIADMDAKDRSGKGYGVSRATYAAEVVAGRLTGRPCEKGFTSAAMAWGTEYEAEARSLYEFMKDVTVQQVGIVLHPRIENAQCSPDGLVGDDGMVQFKCPDTKKHIDTLLGGSIDGCYVKQVQFEMACCERQWCDFVSYDPRLPAEMQLHVTRIARDPAMIMALEGSAIAFLATVAQTVADLKARYSLQEAA